MAKLPNRDFVVPKPNTDDVVDMLPTSVAKRGR